MQGEINGRFSPRAQRGRKRPFTSHNTVIVLGGAVRGSKKIKKKKKLIKQHHLRDENIDSHAGFFEVCIDDRGFGP